MLRQRLITAALLFLLVLVLIFWAPFWVFLSFLVLLAFLSGLEWGRLSLLSASASVVLATLLAVLLPLSLFLNDLPWHSMVYSLVLAWSLFLLFIVRASPTRLETAAFWQRPISAILLFPAFLPAYLLVLQLQSKAPMFLLWVIVLISAGDIGAMTLGKLWGRRRLVAQISPGKTWEGLFGGLLGSAIVGTLGVWIWRGPVLLELLSGALLGLLTGAFAVLGDLAESYLKRRADCKDSGQLLPGHGGLLDRLDSMSAGIPAFVAGLYYLGWWK